MPIPEWFRPMPDASPDEFTEAVDLQLDLAQREYDPTGHFAQRRKAEWLVHASQDTRGLSPLPAVYQNEETSVSVVARIDDEGEVRVALATKTDPDARPDIYSNSVEEELPIIVALLGRIAGVELAELESHPRRAIRTLAKSPGAIALECMSAQKTLELPDTPGGAINLTYYRITGSLDTCDARLARQITLPEGTFLYEQNVIRDGRNPDALYFWPRTFMLSEGMLMGEAYSNAPMYGTELVERAVPGEMRKSVFEDRLRRVGTNNATVGALTMADAVRIVSQPLSQSYRLEA